MQACRAAAPTLLADRAARGFASQVHAQNVHLFADDRLASNVTAVTDRSSMLAELRELEVVEHSPSPSLCAHRGIDAQRCGAAELRSVGLLASRIASAMPAAVATTTTSLRLDDGQEAVENVRSLDVAALLTRMVGSIQALDEQLRESRQEIAELRAAVKQLS